MSMMSKRDTNNNTQKTLIQLNVLILLQTSKTRSN